MLSAPDKRSMPFGAPVFVTERLLGGACNTPTRLPFSDSTVG